MDAPFDVAVLGGGPAGSAAAHVLARGGARVVLLEAGTFGAYRAGECLHPRANPLLARLGVEPRALPGAARSQVVLAVWGGAGGVEARDALVSPWGPGWRQDRRVLDRALCEAAGRAGASCRLGLRVRAARREGGAWALAVQGSCGPATVRARRVVDGLGRGGDVPGAPTRSMRWLDRLVAFVRTVPFRMEDDPHDGALLVESTPAGWWYTVATDARSLVAAFLTDADLLPDAGGRAAFLDARRAEAPETLRRTSRSGRVGRAGPPRGLDARTGVSAGPFVDDWVWVGDRGLPLDPLSGHGVLRALESGVGAAEALLAGGEDPRTRLGAWRRAALSGWQEEAMRGRAVYASETRWAEQAFWARRRGAGVLAPARAVPRIGARLASVRGAETTAG